MSSDPSFVPPDEGPRVAALTRAFAAGELSPVEVTRAALDRAEAIDPTLNAFVSLDRDGALVAAEASETRWRAGAPLSPIDGIPTTIKELVWVKGWTIPYGSTTTAPVPAPEDAPAVARLRAAGAVLFGLTTSPEFGWKALTDGAAHGITRNPWNPALTSGGSSGGAAVAAATGAGVLHLGTDGGGSIRVPAAFCGIAGLKPTFGRVPARPASSFGTLAHLGPMTRHAEDLVPLLAAMSGRDLSDWPQGAGVLTSLDPVDPQGVFEGKTVGVWSTPPCGTVDPVVATAFEASLKILEALGATLVPFDLPDADRLADVFEKHWFTGAANRLTAVPADRRGEVDPGFLEVAAAGAAMGAVDLVAAQVARAGFGAAMDERLAELDFVVSPATAILPFAAGREVPEGSGLARWHLWAGFSFPLNLSQQPAAVVPAVLSPDGLPIALQIVGARGADAAVLAATIAFERARGALRR